MQEEHQLSDRHCSLDQVMFGLRQVYEDSWRPSREPLTLDAPLQNLVGDDLEGFRYDLVEVFGVWVWCDRIGYFLNRDATVGKFAEFLRGILPEANLAPVRIAGTSCDKAAAFFAIESILRSHGVNDRLAPSQRIQDILSFNQIDQLWHGLHWVLQGRDIPREQWEPSRVIDATSYWHCAGLTLFVGLILACGGIPELLLVFGLPALLLAFAGKALMDGISPLPNGVETFRDLASLIARQRQSCGLV